ncbi:MAG: hypothetical protein Q8O55_08735 [Dehalococcoidales bacterium]|nr:hypothetical protein [Dehalococcoidales bacterium]
MTHWIDSWGTLNPTPCQESIDWAKTQPDWQTAWNNCERGDWMLHRLARNMGEWGSPAHRKLVLAACQCARLALPYVAEGEKRPLLAIELAERWAKGEAISREQLRNAADAAYTSDAAYAAYAAYASATADAAHKKPLKECADIIRKAYPEAP